MNKCEKCGTEFEGKFCPECGDPWKAEGEKTCPNCGAAVKEGAKFCSECGYSFEKPQPAKQDRQLTAGVRKLYAAVSVLPAALLGAFSVLLFLFFLAPVAVMPGGNLFGEKIPSMSYGNVYAGSNYAGMSFTDSITALIVFAALALFAAFLIAVSCAFHKLRDMRFTVGGKKVFLRNILTAVGYILFFALFLISCILMGQIADADGGLGVIKAGAAPILVLVFTLVCQLAALVCAFAGGYLRKTYPVLAEATEEKIAAAKPTKAETWIKKHKVWAAGISAVLVVAIVVGVAVPVGLANRHNGTYYAYNGETEEYDTARYFKLTGGAWQNENGEKGKISFDGEKVTLSYSPVDGADIAGSSAAQIEGTIKGDVLNIGGAVFVKGNHEHNFEWETVVEATCVTWGKKDGTCACGRYTQEDIRELGHRFKNHICDRCGVNSGFALIFWLNEEQTGYIVANIGYCNDPDIIIPSEYNDKPVTEIHYQAFFDRDGLKSIIIPDHMTLIGDYAFWSCGELTSITISDSVIEIGEGAFEDCSKLTDIQFKGTVAKWQAIKKWERWDNDTGDYTVTCTDGTVDKGGNVRYFN